ncbi:MAG: DUF4139 domain-containing protein [Prevotellaceae bacterium]|jgi:TonB-dependent SusC/RagA subfamily outer membrane receptor|nr:DUF4139 domain-containing protein [Prevotellaceae bacterium]
MKKIYFFAIFSLLSAVAVADNTKTTLKSVTVFFKGAELAHTASVMLKAGENTVTLEGLSPAIDVNSLKINVNNSVVVASSEFSTDYLTEKKSSDLVQKLQDSIETVNAELLRLTTTVNINTNALALLKKGIEHNLTGEVETATGTVKRGLSVAELTQNLEYYNIKATVLETSLAADNKKKEEFYKTLQRLNSQLNQEKNKNGKYSGVLKLTLVSPLAANATITVTYYTANASWTPYYDMNIASTDKPIVLQGRSKVRQTTGLDWEKVKITLSTATPSRTKDAPVFQTWFLNFGYANNYSSKAMSNSITYNKRKDMIYFDEAVADVKEYSINSVKASTAPLYVVDGVPYYGDISSMDPSTIASTTALDDANATSLYGSQGSNGVILITTKKIEDYVTTEEKNINMEYAIDLPYTIPGNGKEQIIDLKSYKISANYKYYAAPKLDENAFLVADLKDWEKLNILSGMANITYEGTYVGQTFLNTVSTNSVLSITLGTDKRVSVKREKMTDYSSVKFMGTDTKITLTYRLTVKNNQNKPIHITLKENYPVSSQKEIDVELNEKITTTPTVNKKDIGVITWEVDLEVGESKEYQIAYSVKYPKDKTVNLY